MLDTAWLASAMTRNKSSLPMWVACPKTWPSSDQPPSKDPWTKTISWHRRIWWIVQWRLGTPALPNSTSFRNRVGRCLQATILRPVNISRRTRCKEMAWISLWSKVRTSSRSSGVIVKSTWLPPKKKELKCNWEWKKRKSNCSSCTGTTRTERG